MTRRPWLLVVSCLMSACNSGREGALRDSTTMAVDSGEAPRRLASDAILTIVNSARLAAPLRAAADSFAGREAVQVLQERMDDAGVAGSLDTARIRAALGQSPDVVALRAEAFPQMLIPAHTTWYVLFARDRMVLAYRDSTRGAATIDSTNWWKVLQRRGMRVGRVAPTAGPAGYRALLVLQLADAHYGEPRLAAKLLAASPSRYVRPTEADLVSMLDSGDVDYAWLHESTASAAGVRFLRLPHETDLGEPADSSLYAAVEVAVPRDSLGDTVRVRGAPIAYGMSIPNAATSPRHAERFLRFLLSEEGRRLLRAGHLDVVSPPVAVGSDVPPAILASLGSGPP